MIPGLYPPGTLPPGAIETADLAADYDPYAGVYPAPPADRIILVEIDVRQEPT